MFKIGDMVKIVGRTFGYGIVVETEVFEEHKPACKIFSFNRQKNFIIPYHLLIKVS
jgi:hypothetical protein